MNTMQRPRLKLCQSDMQCIVRPQQKSYQRDTRYKTKIWTSSMYIPHYNLCIPLHSESTFRPDSPCTGLLVHHSSVPPDRLCTDLQRQNYIPQHIFRKNILPGNTDQQDTRCTHPQFHSKSCSRDRPCMPSLQMQRYNSPDMQHMYLRPPM